MFSSLFQQIGFYIDSALKWLFKFNGNDIQMLFWGGLISALLFFFIEFLRRPKAFVTFLDHSQPYNLLVDVAPDRYIISTNWKIKVQYKSSLLGKLLFRYPMSNTKVRVSLFDDSCRIIENFILKPDSNPDVVDARDIPFSIAGINISRNEEETFPVFNYSEEYGWIVFEVWNIYLQFHKRKKLLDGKYFIQIKLSSDQIYKKLWFVNHLSKDGSFVHRKLNLFEKIKTFKL